jgi:hypothetical protein
MPVEFCGQKFIQLAKRRLVRGVVVAGHTVVFAIPHLPGVALPFPFEPYVGDLVENKIWHARIRKVRILQHHAKANALVVTAGEVECDLPPLRKLEAPWSFLHISPVGADVNFLSEG